MTRLQSNQALDWAGAITYIYRQRKAQEILNNMSLIVNESKYYVFCCGQGLRNTLLMLINHAVDVIFVNLTKLIEFIHSFIEFEPDTKKNVSFYNLTDLEDFL